MASSNYSRARACALLLTCALAVLQGAAAQGHAGLQFLARAGAGSAGPSIVENFDPATQPCITDPQEYATAFKARSPRCTSGLAVRLGAVSTGVVPATWEAAVRAGKKAPTGWNEAEKRVREGLFQKWASFFGVGDQPTKYLAIGNPTAPRGSITTIPNGMAFLEQIGYQLADADVTQVGVLMVIRDPATLSQKGKYKKGYFGPYTANGTTLNIKNAKAVPKNNKNVDTLVQPWPKSFPPTFDSLMAYIAAYWKAAIGVTLSPEDVKATAAAMNSNSFQQLTGCPGICVFEDLAFPDPTGSTYFPPANTAVRLGTYKPDGTCVITDYPFPAGTITAATIPDPLSDANPKPLVPRFRRVLADAADPWSPNCTDANYLRYLAYAYKKPSPCPSFTDFTGGLNQNGLLTQFVTFWNEAGATARTRATLVRTFLTLSCFGNFNPLFAGNGDTYTGTGGFYAPLGSEQIMEQLTPVRPAAPVKMGTGVITLPGCSTNNGSACWNGLPYIAGPCLDADLKPTGEGLLCDAKNGLKATFLPICFNGNTPNTDSSTYPNNDPTFACLPGGKKCVNGTICCSDHCNSMSSPHGFDPTCATNKAQPGCDIGNCRSCRFASDATADMTLPLCPACLCLVKKINATTPRPPSDCDPAGFM